MTKIDIISGFLGAGKTTFIKKMLEQAFVGEQIVLIENEFGEVGIDGGFLKDAGIEITEMNSGCICCSLVGDFATNLNEVITKYHPDRILIEPSGVGKLSDVMKSVVDIEKEQDVKLNALVTVVNAVKAKKQMKAFGEFFNNQIEHATTIVLSRSQNASSEQLEECVKMMQELNEKAAIITTAWDAIDGKQILKVMEGQDNLEMKVLAEHHAHHHHHDHGDDCTCGCHDHEHHHDHDDECECGHHHDHEEHHHDHDHEHHGHHHEEDHDHHHGHHHEEDHEHHGHCHEEDHEHHHGHCHEEDHEHHGHCHEEGHEHHHGHCHEEDHEHHSHCHEEDHEHHGHCHEEDHEHHGHCHEEDHEHHGHCHEEDHEHHHGHCHEEGHEHHHGHCHEEDHEHHSHCHEEGHEHHDHHHDHDEHCTCGCHDHDHGHHHHHHADDVFTSWGKETPHKFDRARIEEILKIFCDTEDYGTILRAKGMVEGTDGTWIYFDMVPGEYELRDGQPDYTGRLCVIGTDIDDHKLMELFGIA